jgi:hypothetical protein
MTPSSQTTGPPGYPARFIIEPTWNPGRFRGQLHTRSPGLNAYLNSESERGCHGTLKRRYCGAPSQLFSKDALVRLIDPCGKASALQARRACRVPSAAVRTAASLPQYGLHNDEIQTLIFGPK